jgi:hypothetical protein
VESVWGSWGAALVHVTMGIGLASCAGLRAFLPLFMIGLAGRLDLVTLSGSFTWLESWAAIVVFGVAVLAEILADKFPVVDNALDAIQTFVKPTAGALVMATVVEDWTPLYATVFWIVMGGSSAGLVHVTKAKLRLVSTATTAGLGNPVLSASEDVGALAGTVGSIAVPPVMVLVLVAGAVLAWVVVRRFRPRAP